VREHTVHIRRSSYCSAKLRCTFLQTYDFWSQSNWLSNMGYRIYQTPVGDVADWGSAWLTHCGGCYWWMA